MSNIQKNSSSITFYCPNHLKSNFDDLVKFKRISRTSIINFLMEHWVRTEHDRMKRDNELQSFLNDVKLQNHFVRGKIRTEQSKVSNRKKENSLIPTIEDDHFDWEQRLGSL